MNNYYFEYDTNKYINLSNVVLIDCVANDKSKEYGIKFSILNGKDKYVKYSSKAEFTMKVTDLHNLLILGYRR